MDIQEEEIQKQGGGSFVQDDSMFDDILEIKKDS